MKYGGKRHRDEHSDHSSECRTDERHEEYIEGREIESTAHHHRDHDISFDPLEKDIETRNSYK